MCEGLTLRPTSPPPHSPREKAEMSPVGFLNHDPILNRRHWTYGVLGQGKDFQLWIEKINYNEIK